MAGVILVLTFVPRASLAWNPKELKGDRSTDEEQKVVTETRSPGTTIPETGCQVA